MTRPIASVDDVMHDPFDCAAGGGRAEDPQCAFDGWPDELTLRRRGPAKARCQTRRSPWLHPATGVGQAVLGSRARRRSSGHPSGGRLAGSADGAADGVAVAASSSTQCPAMKPDAPVTSTPAWPGSYLITD